MAQHRLCWEQLHLWIPGVYCRACWNKGGKLTLGIQKSGTDILRLNKITLINRPLRKTDRPWQMGSTQWHQSSPRDGSCAWAARLHLGTWPAAPALTTEHSPHDRAQVSTQQPHGICEGDGSQGIQVKPLVKFCLTSSLICNRDVAFPWEDKSGTIMCLSSDIKKYSVDIFSWVCLWSYFVFHFPSKIHFIRESWYKLTQTWHWVDLLNNKAGEW